MFKDGENVGKFNLRLQKNSKFKGFKKVEIELLNIFNF